MTQDGLRGNRQIRHKANMKRAQSAESSPNPAEMTWTLTLIIKSYTNRENSHERTNARTVSQATWQEAPTDDRDLNQTKSYVFFI